LVPGGASQVMARHEKLAIFRNHSQIDLQLQKELFNDDQRFDIFHGSPFRKTDTLQAAQATTYLHLS